MKGLWFLLKRLIYLRVTQWDRECLSIQSQWVMNQTMLVSFQTQRIFKFYFAKITQQKNVSLWTGTVSSVDHQISLGRNAQPPAPHPFQCQMTMSFSRWFPLTFIIWTPCLVLTQSLQPSYNVLTNACPNNLRGRENINVLAPQIAALFNQLITKANVPRSWKKAKLTPIHKKGLVRSQGTIEWLRWVGHCTDFTPICYIPRSKTGVPITTRPRTHN